MDKRLVYPTLTRPDLLLGGIPRSYIPITIIASALIGILTQNILIGLATWPVWSFAGFMAAKIDPYFIEVWRVKTQSIRRTKGRHQGNYYHA